MASSCEAEQLPPGDAGLRLAVYPGSGARRARRKTVDISTQEPRQSPFPVLRTTLMAANVRSQRHFQQETVLYDVFISHASDDKDDFVRPLAEALQRHRVEVWYDEFTLKPGDSLRRSIDRGLTKSRYGIVVLSKRFFKKRWTEWELDGLVQRQLSSSNRLIIPIWHGVDRKTVLDYSAPLADIVAIRSRKGVDEVVAELLRILFPEGSTLLIARDALIAKGFEPPVVTDDWWLDVIACSGDQWEKRWHFPIWKLVPQDAHRGQLLAWEALQTNWQMKAESRPVTQMTRPEAVLEFIDSQPGLGEACGAFPGHLLDYAPQLAIRGFGGRWEQVFDEMLDKSVAESLARREKQSNQGSALTIDGRTPACGENLVLRHPTFGNYKPSDVACGFVQGNGAGFGSRIRAFDHFDYLIWLLSDESSWLPEAHHSYLLEGMKDWGAWKATPEDGAFSEQLYAALQDDRSKEFCLSREARADLFNRIMAVRKLLGLPESPEELVQIFLESDCIERWLNLTWHRPQRCPRNSHSSKRSKGDSERQ